MNLIDQIAAIRSELTACTHTVLTPKRVVDILGMLTDTLSALVGGPPPSPEVAELAAPVEGGGLNEASLTPSAAPEVVAAEASKLEQADKAMAEELAAKASAENSGKN